VERGVGATDALPILLVGWLGERLLELLQERLRLQLGLDGDLLGERDQEAAPLDQPADDVLVASFGHARALSPSSAPAAAASSRASGPWRRPAPPRAPFRRPGTCGRASCARARRPVSARRAASLPRSRRRGARGRCRRAPAPARRRRTPRRARWPPGRPPPPPRACRRRPDRPPGRSNPPWRTCRVP